MLIAGLQPTLTLPLSPLFPRKGTVHQAPRCASMPLSCSTLTLPLADPAQLLPFLSCSLPPFPLAKVRCIWPHGALLHPFLLLRSYPSPRLPYPTLPLLPPFPSQRCVASGPMGRSSTPSLLHAYPCSNPPFHSPFHLAKVCCLRPHGALQLQGGGGVLGGHDTCRPGCRGAGATSNLGQAWC